MSRGRRKRRHRKKLARIRKLGTPANRLTMAALLRNTDVMADVLGFLPRKVIALRLACVNRRFSALCNCWCQPEVEEDGMEMETANEGLCPQTQQSEKKWRDDDAGGGVGSSDDPSSAESAGTGSSHRNHRLCWSCASIHCVHVIGHLFVLRTALAVNNCNSSSPFHETYFEAASKPGQTKKRCGGAFLLDPTRISIRIGIM